MKPFSLCFFLCLITLFGTRSLAAQNLPEPIGFVNDFAGVIRQEDKREIENLAEKIKERTGAEIVVVTVDNFRPFGSIDEFSVALAQKWGIGEKGEDTGVLLVLAAIERRVRIEVGYGLEGAIPDFAAGRILDRDVIPDLKAGNFSRGLLAGARSIALHIARNKGLSETDFIFPAVPNQAATSQKKTKDDSFPYKDFIILFFYLPVLITILISKNRKKLLKKFVSDVFGNGGYRGGGGFGRGGGFGGGGFRGFGGGGFGGGGASRGF